MGHNVCNGQGTQLGEQTDLGADVEGSPGCSLLWVSGPTTNEPSEKTLEMCEFGKDHSIICRRLDERPREEHTGSGICFSSHRVPLIPAFSVFGILFLVIVGLAVSFPTGATEPSPVCQPCHYSAPCEEDWIWYRGKCYYFAETYDEWNNSQSFCVSHNASLSLIDTQEELDFLRRHKGLYDHWIGLYRDTNEPGWVWANGSMFRNTFPIVGDSPCVYLNNGHVGSAACHGDKKWICNKMDANGHMTHFY
ncbi:hypothetical protein XENTR_v10017620 [Xenopus tropicalis]|uniref:C-type lectin domain family 2 member E-like isoform X1 n=1 Tax=Xenopus tropicalis TaxID=8364 RepID=A0A8J1JTQ2_XENTR|nr:C-type lectin domain family 2 member E-like isoform X1 [Xenopus tropicalis]KAE8589568.1 hypothetical protein XENTR_v10017620 [Xenopus tropicalis]